MLHQIADSENHFESLQKENKAVEKEYDKVVEENRLVTSGLNSVSFKTGQLFLT